MQLLGNPVAEKIENSEIMPKTKNNHCHLAIIEVGNGHQGVMSGQRFFVAKKLLPKNIQAGNKLYFELMSEDMKNKRQKNLAEAVLKEIIGQETESETISKY